MGRYGNRRGVRPRPRATERIVVEIREERVAGLEQIVIGVDAAIGYHAIIAIHSTALGPAVGGTRFWQYRNQDEAMHDALRLARGMTYKTALAGLPLGGGKSVIIGDPKVQGKAREAIFRAHGRLIASLGGKYFTGEDVGSSPADMEFVYMETPYVGGLKGHSGDPSPLTARGVLRAMQAAAKFRWGSDDLSGKHVALQGCGNVGYALAKQLHEAGATLTVSDIDKVRVQRAVDEFDAAAVEPERIFATKADLFAPCALGGILNDDTIPQLRVEIITGSANNQLLEPRHGDELDKRGILYAPDYAANAGGVISFGVDYLHWERDFMLRKVDRIYDTLLKIFDLARQEHIPTHRAADRLAEERLCRGASAAS